MLRFTLLRFTLIRFAMLVWWSVCSGHPPRIGSEAASSISSFAPGSAAVVEYETHFREQYFEPLLLGTSGTIMQIRSVKLHLGR